MMALGLPLMTHYNLEIPLKNKWPSKSLDWSSITFLKR